MDLTPKERTIVALDVETAEEALELVTQLQQMVGMFKIGSRLFTSAGPKLVEKIVDGGNKVFLDLKFHDIPHQVASAVRSATRLRVAMLTVHAAGGREMLRRAAVSANETAQREGIATPSVVAVTVLTSIDSNVLAEIGILTSPVETVTRLALLAASAGVNGVVASPQEISAVRAAVADPSFLIVTPGIRPEFSETEDWATSDDQKRVASPKYALKAGADYLVVGRPITAAKDVAAAALRIATEIQGRAVAT
jgi:orotidine-5'-phosphate decarboxylase